MGLFSFRNFFKPKKAITPGFAPDEYVPIFWEDDYCQIEMVPFQNKTFIQKQAEQINELAGKSKTQYGFMETFERGPMPFKTISKKIRVNYLEDTLTGFQFLKARYIRYNKNEILECEKENTKAFGFTNFTIFFDIENEFVKNIWISTGLISSVTQYDLIVAALCTLGKNCELILIDWNSLSFFDLADKVQVNKYLWNLWK